MTELAFLQTQQILHIIEKEAKMSAHIDHTKLRRNTNDLIHSV